MELGQKMAGPLDGAGEDAGKETDKQGVIEKILFGAKLFLINIQGVTEALEGKIRKPQRCAQIQQSGPLTPQNGIEEIEILIEEQNTAAGERRDT